MAISRKQALSPAITDINRLVAGMSDLLRRTLGESVTVEAVMAGGVWPSFIDPNQVESVLLNLAINACDAMRRAGKLTIESSNAVLDQDYARLHGNVAVGQYSFVAVSDTGSEITLEGASARV